MAEQQIEQLVLLLQHQGILDEQFTQLMQLQDESNPDFVAEVVQLYFEDSASKMERICGMVSQPTPDYNELDQLVHQFKGSSASLGAATIAQICIKLREGCQTQNRDLCAALAVDLRTAYGLLQSQLQIYMALEAQRKAGR